MVTDDRSHAVSTNTMRKNIARTVTQARSIDRVQDLASLRYHN